MGKNIEFSDYIARLAKKCIDPINTARQLSRLFDVKVTQEQPYTVRINLISDRISSAEILVSTGNYADETGLAFILECKYVVTGTCKVVLKMKKGQYITARVHGHNYIPLKAYI